MPQIHGYYQITEGRLVAVRYRPSIKVLKERCWHFCNQCGFQQSIDEFKRMLLTV